MITTTNEQQRAPLEGLRILDLTIAMSGPLCTQRLGQMGAEIIKIEAPGGGDFSRAAPMAGVTKFGDSTCYVTMNQNKRSLVLDLKADAGRETLYRLVKQADVLVQNFRPRVASKLGIEYTTLSKINPRLVYGSISGYGSNGPMKDRPGQDLLLQSFTGLTMNGGRKGELPAASPLYMVDVTASHILAEGVLAALLARSVTDQGQEVEVTMLGAIMEMQCQEITTWLAAETKPARGTAPQVSIYMEPPYGIYKTAAGFLAIAQADLAVLAKTLELPNLAAAKNNRPVGDEGAGVAAWRDEIYQQIATKLATETAEHWDEQLAALGVWCMVVNDYERFLNHPQAADRLVTIDHPVAGEYQSVAPGFKFSDCPAPPLSAAPAYGAHSEAILLDFGFSIEETAQLCTDGVIMQAANDNLANATKRR